MKAYCLKCKAMKEIVDEEEVTYKNGVKAMKGKCCDCGTNVSKILGK